MKIVQRYCKNCGKICKHTKTKEDTGFERIFMGIMTLGFAEMVNANIYQCGKCGKVSKILP